MKEYHAKFFNELSNTEVYEILKSRSQIFHLEQNIHYLDQDDVDYNALHCFIKDNDQIIAYLRAYKQDNDIKIGRVLSLYHGQGDGSILLENAEVSIKEKLQVTSIKMDAQLTAVNFYKKHGYVVTSDEYLEEGIVHVDMEKVL